MRQACGNACVDLQNDNNHCGMCGRRCSGDDRCQRGECN
jgi:hypothetical protein